MNSLLHRKQAGFTLVELMIVVALISLLAGLAVPAFARGRKKAQATRILEDLRLLDSALDRWAIDNNKAPGDVAAFSDIQPYIKPGSPLHLYGADVLGNSYGTTFSVDSVPKVPALSFSRLSDVAPAAFWSPYN
jgi:prepilin-type N-terminal cleavage/methylation domain-containing protein